MMKGLMTTKTPGEQVAKDIRRVTRKLHSSDEKIRIVVSGLLGEDDVAELCRKEGIAGVSKGPRSRPSLMQSRSGMNAWGRCARNGTVDLL
jgi:hypothetical protein